MKIINVETSLTYQIIVEKGALDKCGEYFSMLKKNVKASIITDDKVKALYLNRVKMSLESFGFLVSEFVFANGEKSKNSATYLNAINFLADNKFDRGDIVIALGGGVVGDLAGFVASTYMRGIDYFQIPTTLLALIDSSIGGKTAIDLPQGKNLLGTFYQPKAVLADIDVLKTLDDENILNGLGEGVKYAVLDGGELFNILTSDIIDWERFIILCMESKKRVVEADEKEVGLRKLLNLGHTFGHAIEQLSNYSLPHGVCVAKGLAIINKIAVKSGLMDEIENLKILNLMDKIKLNYETPFTYKQLLNVIDIDKKVKGDSISLVIPKKIGECEIVDYKLNELGDLKI